MTAQSMRMDTIAENIANAQTTRDEHGKTYRRKTVVFAEKTENAFQYALDQSRSNHAVSTTGNGVKVTAIVEDHVASLVKVYDPAHPDADDDGYVTYPNVNTVTEMTNLIDATRSYEANVTAINAAKSMTNQALDIGKG